MQITHTYTYHVCAANSTIELPCEKYDETKYMIQLFGFKIHKNTHQSKKNKRCVTLWPCHLHEKYLKAKEELWKLKYFTMQKYINFQNNPLKETKILQDIITL